MLVVILDEEPVQGEFSSPNEGAEIHQERFHHPNHLKRVISGLPRSWVICFLFFFFRMKQLKSFFAYLLL
jgi:hypothetical protein